MAKGDRPFRAVAYIPDPTGQTAAGRKREVAGRTAAKTLEGLKPFILRHQAQGHIVHLEEVLDMLEGLDEDET